MNNLLFLSQGIQMVLFILLVGLVLVFMKSATLEHRIKRTEEDLGKYVSYDIFMETINNLVDAKLDGQSISAFPSSSEA